MANVCRSDKAKPPSDSGAPVRQMALRLSDLRFMSRYDNVCRLDKAKPPSDSGAPVRQMALRLSDLRFMSRYGKCL
ncbi:hypothetical protein [Kluyvera ascorbata]|uniref:hypothetical protein n=1 Tax=Kluyvera ascorbata TaxID=51288 RepID=UPI0039F66828